MAHKAKENWTFEILIKVASELYSYEYQESEWDFLEKFLDGKIDSISDYGL